MNFDETVIAFLGDARRLIVILHLAGLAVGVGAATITDVFFFTFLKKFSIFTSESEIMHTLSKIIWIALGVVVLSGLALYLPGAAGYNETPKFLAKMIVVAVIIANGFVLNMFVAPRMSKISFQKDPQADEVGRRFRRLAFAFGSLSITSWYSALVLGALRRVTLPFSTIMLVYICALIIAISVSQIMEQNFAKKARSVLG